MSARVSKFGNVRIGDFNYLFFVVGWNDYATVVRDEVTRQLDAFGKDLGTSGNVVQPYPERLDTITDEIMKKNWPEGFGQRLEGELDPFMLIISMDFDAFDPQQHPWGIIWFSEYSNYANDIARLFHKLALMCRKNQDILAYLSSVARRKRSGQAVIGLRKVTKYFEIKPQVFGISVDVKALVEDILEAGIDALDKDN